MLMKAVKKGTWYLEEGGGNISGPPSGLSCPCGPFSGLQDEVRS